MTIPGPLPTLLINAITVRKSLPDNTKVFIVEGFTEVDGVHSETTQRYDRAELEYILSATEK